LRTLARQRLSLPLKGAFAEYRDGFFGRDFAPLGLLMNGLIFRRYRGLFRPKYGCLSVLDS